MSLSRYNHYNPFGFDDFFGPPFGGPLMPVLRADFPRDEDMILRRASPGYEINEDDTKFQIAIDVPGVKAGDMQVDLEHGGRVLHLSGGRKVQSGDTYTETKFDKQFTIGEDVDTTRISANLADGVLVVTAPKKGETKTAHTITITEGPAPGQIEEDKKE